ncbi:MAG: kinase-like protein [Monoraphidium minutum]|nr:MAG: kinase-like protein [Monoraphidium minutum]
MDGRYELFACKGKGVFSTVLRARDNLRADPNNPAAKAEVAIKMIRANDTMARAAQLEMRILKALADADPDNRKHVIRLLRSFEYRSHVCLVFESMDMNLRELTNKYGRGVGLNATAVGVYAAQLLVALRHLKRCRVLHADIKPDNILVNARRSKVKICDFGSAMFAGENERTPYLVSRFYRAPEVILGLAYDYPMDMWSIGCVLYELFTGRILFPGRTNNDMLRTMMEVKGPFPRKMLKKGIFVEKHFEDDANMSFALMEEDPVSKMPVRRLIPNPTVKHNFAQLLARSEGDKAKVSALADLLERMMALDPERRIDPDAALRHPFVKDYVPKKRPAAAGAAAGGGGAAQ